MPAPRQPKPDDFGQLKVRVKSSLRKHLEREAGKNDRTLNSEIIARLQASLAAPKAVAPHNETLAQHVATCAQLIETASGKTWRDDKETRRQLLDAVEELLEAALRTPKDALLAAIDTQQYGPNYARFVLGDITHHDLIRAGKGGEELKRVLDELGEKGSQ